MLAIVDDGLPIPQPVFQARIDVRWGDQDADGHVNNVTILRYVEEARMLWSRALGLHDQAPELMSVVKNLACEYARPIHYPACLDVSIACAHVGNSSVQLLFTLREARQDGETYAQARMTWVWVHAQSRRPHAMPARLRQACLAESSTLHQD